MACCWQATQCFANTFWAAHAAKAGANAVRGFAAMTYGTQNRGCAAEQCGLQQAMMRAEECRGIFSRLRAGTVAVV